MAETNMQTTAKRSEQPGRVVIDFDDNRLLGSLYGLHDENLARLEQLLDVTIASRGNRLVIDGPDAASRLAGSVLEGLYGRLRDGEGIEHGDIDGAVRMATGASNRDQGQRAAGRVAAPVGRVMEIRTRKRTIVARSPRQARFIECLVRDPMVFGIGPAGTGKTYLAVAAAVAGLLAGEADRIIISRPAVEAGENLGFLPGDLKEKVDPYLRPIYDALYDMLPTGQVEKFLESGQIEIAPLAFMRGRTLSDAFVILDEAQNTTAMQMKMFLTRFGQNSRMVIAGDPSQIDLPGGARSGLIHALDILKDINQISVVRFGEEDVVRHPLVSRIVGAYAKDGARDDGAETQR